MTRRRYTDDQLIPVHRLMSTTYRRPGDPAAGTRQECWEATSTDGLWSFARVEDTGSPWAVQHLPTEFVPVAVQWSALDDARHDAHTGRLCEDLWAAALWFLALREYAGGPHTVNDHDRARAYLTWAAEHGRDPSGCPVPLELVCHTG